MEDIKKKDVLRSGSSLKIYTSAAVSKKCFNVDIQRNTIYKSTLNVLIDLEPNVTTKMFSSAY